MGRELVQWEADQRRAAQREIEMMEEEVRRAAEEAQVGAGFCCL